MEATFKQSEMTHSGQNSKENLEKLKQLILCFISRVNIMMIVLLTAM